MAAVIRDAVVKLALQQEKAKVEAPDVSDAVKALKEQEDAAKRLAEQEAKMHEARQRAAQAQEEAIYKIRDSTGQILQAAQGAGEGLFLLARATALLGSEGSEDLQRLLEKLIVIQGMFDLYKGSVMIIKGVIDGLKAIREAKIAVAAASELAAAAEIMHAKGMAGTAAAAIALQAALAPLLLIAGAVALAVGALWFAWKRISGSSAENEEAIEKQREALERWEKTAELSHRNTLNRIRREGAGVAGGGTLESLQQQQQIYGSGSMAGKTAAALEREQRILEIIQAKRETIAQQKRDELAEQEKLVQSTQRELDLRERAIQQAQSALKTAQDQLRAEQDKTRSLEAQFGAMNAMDQARVAQLAEKAKAGTLTTGEAVEFQQRFGGLAERAGVGDFLAKKGREAAAGFGIDRGLFAGAEAERQAAVDEARMGVSSVTGGGTAQEALAEIQSARVRSEKAFKDFADSNATVLETITQQQNAITRRLEDIDVGLAAKGG